ncbi:MAG: acyl carrier protein [Planctomycetota bacterium]|nr:acyl carrier protein [Planctomycetota bacterium]
MTSTNDLTEGEGLLRGLWSALLEVPPEVEPDFIRAGGSSLLLMEIQLGMQKQSGIWIDLDTLDLPIRFEQMCSLLRAQDASRSEVDSSETGVEVLRNRKSPWSTPRGQVRSLIRSLIPSLTRSMT